MERVRERGGSFEISDPPLFIVSLKADLHLWLKFSCLFSVYSVPLYPMRCAGQALVKVVFLFVLDIDSFFAE